MHPIAQRKDCLHQTSIDQLDVYVLIDQGMFTSYIHTVDSSPSFIMCHTFHFMHMTLCLCRCLSVSIHENKANHLTLYTVRSACNHFVVWSAKHWEASDANAVWLMHAWCAGMKGLSTAWWPQGQMVVDHPKPQIMHVNDSDIHMINKLPILSISAHHNTQKHFLLKSSDLKHDTCVICPPSLCFKVICSLSKSLL